MTEQEKRKLNADVIKVQNTASKTGKQLSKAQAIVSVMKAREA